MRVALRERWVRALNGGTYLQGKLRLRSEGRRFCCLGVLQDVAEPAQWAVSGSADAHWLRPEVAQRLGLTTVNGRFELDWLLSQESIWLPLVAAIISTQQIKGIATVGDIVGRIQEDEKPSHAGRRMTSLSQLNDRGVPFSVIAQIVMGNPPGLFVGVVVPKQLRRVKSAKESIKAGDNSWNSAPLALTKGAALAVPLAAKILSQWNMSAATLRQISFDAEVAARILRNTRPS
jgi:hypothetical protein